MKRAFVAFAAALSLIVLLGGCRTRVVPAPKKKEPPRPAPPSLSWRFEYDDSDRLTLIVDPGGQETTFEYHKDESGRLDEWTRKHADGTQVTYRLDGRGRLIEMTDPGGTVRYEYDEFGRLVAVQRDDQPAVQYGYDAQDRLASLRIGDAFEVDYAYDFLGRLASIETPAGSVSYEYRKDAAIRTLPGGIGTAWEYSPGDRLDRIVHFGADKRKLAEYAYVYRPEGPVASVTESSSDDERTVQYQYDTMRRLVEAADSRYGTVAYGYDDFGNRTQITTNDGEPIVTEYDWVSRLVGHAGRECSHDDVGNLTSIAGEQGQRGFRFDAANLLVSATAGDVQIAYGYDGDGRLISRQAGEQSTTFVPDYRSAAWKPLAAIDGQGNAVYFAWEGETPLAAFSGEQVRFFLTDRLGSVRLIVGADGEVGERVDYKPFGALQQPIESTGVEPRFAGLFFDADVSLYLPKGRGYDPVSGRFLQEDPRRLMQGTLPQELSMYAYCANDPVNFVDVGAAQPSIPIAGVGDSGIRAPRQPGSENSGGLWFQNTP